MEAPCSAARTAATKRPAYSIETGPRTTRWSCGAVLAADSRNRGLASLLGAGAATSLGAFFLVTNVLPATVLAAVVLGLEELRSHGRIGQMSPLRLHGRPLGG
jgi:hypothetical protein